jgi:hypothetical protein
MSREFLDKDKKIWTDAIRESKSKIAVLNRSIRIFKQNIRERVPVPDLGVNNTSTAV